VDIKTKIANNIITIERVKMKVSGFRPRFEGQVSFDGKFNLHGRLGLPPFGIIGIPFSVTGNRDNPKVKLRRSKDGDELEEEKDEEEVKADSTINQ
jgi:AsmA protein